MKKDNVSIFFKSLSERSSNKDSIKKTEQLIRTMYDQKNRYYHNLDHINYCLEKLDEYCLSENFYPDDENLLLKFAIIMHDIIYVKENTGDELHSSFVAKTLIREIGYELFGRKTFEDVSSEVENLILITSHKILPNNRNNKVCLESIISDVDLAIFGEDNDLYRLYEKNIRKEYKTMEEQCYINGRIYFLKQLLNRDRIYWTDYFNNKYNKKARINIENSINKLKLKVEKIRPIL